MDIDRERTVRHPNGITQVFATPLADRAVGEPAIGAYRRWGDEYRTYAPDGSPLGVWDTEAEAYAAIVGRPPSHLWPCGCLRNDAGAHRVGCPDHPEGVRG